MKFKNKAVLKIRIFLLRLLMPDYKECVSVKSTHDTMSEIIDLISSKKPGAYLRFGDGEINIIYGVDAIEQSGNNKKIAIEMVEALSLNRQGVLKSLMVHSKKFGTELKMKEGFHLCGDRWAIDIMNLTFNYFIGTNIYSHAALSYSIIYDKIVALNLFRVIRKTKSPIFVGNENIDFLNIKRIFGDEVIFIKTPAKNAFSFIDKIENDIIKELIIRNDYSVVILGVGPSSNILQKRILGKIPNVFLFDMGSSIDALIGNQSRAWIDLIELPENYFNNFIDEI